MRRAVAALLTLAIAGCAAAPEGGGPREHAPGGQAPIQAAVGAFAQACGSLARDAALTRAGALGFVPARGIGAAEPMVRAAEARGATVLVRPNPAPALLFWHDTPHCEVAVPNADGPALEAAFGRLLAALSAAAAVSGAAQFALASPEQIARLVEAEAARGEAGRLVALAVVAPRAPSPGAQARVLSLRLPRPGTNPAFSAMVHRSVPASFGPAGAAAPPALPSDTKDLSAR